MRNKVNILLHGFININLIDGSAVFIAGLAKMLSLNPNVSIDLILATPIKRDINLKDLIEIENIKIISPFDDYHLTESNPRWFKNQRFTHREAASVISYYWEKGNYDWLIMRGMEVAEELYDINPVIFDKLMNYVTGITNTKQTFQSKDFFKKSLIFNKSRYLLCQTDEMKNFIRDKFNINSNKIITLNPMVEDITRDFNKLHKNKDKYDKICYTGKFHKNWNSIPMIVGFREINSLNPNATLHIAGDKFTNHYDIPHYNKDLKYLLENTRNLHWYGALSRADSTALIYNSDIGISWRDESMNDSLELSTKLLEYGTLGKAVIMNRTDMHTKLFGKDYPLYANSFNEFVSKLNQVINDPNLYFEASQRMFEVSTKFTYTATLKKIIPYLMDDEINSFFSKHKFKKVEVIKVSKLTYSENSKLGKKVAVSYKIINMESIKNFLISVSKVGKIIDIVTKNNLIYAVIEIRERDEAVINKNFTYNFENYFLAICNQYIKTQKYLQKNEDNLSILKFKVDSLFKKNTSNFSYSDKTDRDIEVYKARYEAISNSKLGKLQLKYWKFLKKLRN